MQNMLKTKPCVFSELKSCSGPNQKQVLKMSANIPPQPPKSTRLVLDLSRSQNRLDNVLLKAIREQNENLNLREISRMTFKELFKSGKVLIKGQRAKPSSGVAAGLTYVDILGY